MNIDRWSTTASENNSAVPDGAPEGWFGGDVNAWGREAMASVRAEWELSDWRDITRDSGSGGSRYTLTRDSDTQITISSVDLSSVLFVGERVKITNAAAAAVYGVIASVTFSTPNTVVTFTLDEGDDDGTVALTTGNISFSSGTITRVTSTWAADGFVTGDRLVIKGHATNNGVYTVSNISGADMDLTPIASAGYSVNDATAASGTCYRIETVDTIPSAPLEAIYINGTHVRAAPKQADTGFNPLDHVTHEMLGDAAYLREAELSVADSAKLNGDTQGSGGGIDADTVDGLHATEILATKHHYLTADDSAAIATGVETVTDLASLAFPGSPDGAKKFLVRGHIENTGGITSVDLTYRIRMGTAGTTADALQVSWVDSNTTSLPNDYDIEDLVLTPGASDVLTLTIEANNSYTYTLHGDTDPIGPGDTPRCFFTIQQLV